MSDTPSFMTSVSIPHTAMPAALSAAETIFDTIGFIIFSPSLLTGIAIYRTKAHKNCGMNNVKLPDMPVFTGALAKMT